MNSVGLKDIREPKIGDVVVTTISNIYSVCIQQEGKYFAIRSNLDSTEFEIDYDEVEKLGLKYENLDNYKTLLRYEGDAIFTELYSDLKIRFSPIENINSKECASFCSLNAFSKKYGYEAGMDWENLIKYYEKFCQAPLFVCNYEELSDAYLQQIGDQTEQHEFIAYMIRKYRDESYTKLKESIKEIKNIKPETGAINLAYGENILYNFQHGISRKRVLKEDNEKNAE